MLLIWAFVICLINLLTSQTHGYVLFAANLDDFRSIAKKFIPEKLADQLAEMASESSMKYNQKAVNKDEEYEEGDESERDSATTRPYIETMKGTAKKRYEIQSKSKRNPIPEVNIDELVEKVRERLFKGNKRKQKVTTDVKKQKYTDEDVRYTTKSSNQDDNGNADSQNSYETVSDKQKPEYYDEETTKRQNLQKVKPNTDYKDQREDLEQKDYESVTQSDAEANPPQNDGRIFQEVDLRNTNDSYEDYATPSKDKIFESDETKNKNKNIALRHESVSKKQDYKRPRPEDYDDLKARTESLIYDEKEVRQSKATDGAVRFTKTTKNIKAKGTMIPTREYYKMSSPDYYKKLPVIAEKYNFDEPIPEKDREPENLKPIGNPPARINKKVKV